MEVKVPEPANLDDVVEALDQQRNELRSLGERLVEIEIGLAIVVVILLATLILFAFRPVPVKLT
jgi:hypothetical protein